MTSSAPQSSSKRHSFDQPVRSMGSTAAAGPASPAKWLGGAIAGALAIASLVGIAVAQEKPSTGPASDASTKPAPTASAATKPAALPNRPLPKPVPADAAVLTDAMVEAGIRKGATYLLKQFDPKTHWVAGCDEKMKDGNEGYAGGLQALAVYALMQSGLALKNERPPADPKILQEHIDLLKELDLKGQPMTDRIEAMMKFDLSKGATQTYAYGLRATALSLFVTSLPDTTKDNANSPEQAKRLIAHNMLASDAAWCVMATPDGSYTYSKNKKSPKDAKELLDFFAELRKTRNYPVATGGYDSSNSQYGLLGAWSAAEAGIEIPTEYWFMIANHWARKQLPNGQWTYSEDNKRGGTVNMTAAGLASMLVTHEYIEPAIMGGAVGRDPYNEPIRKGLGWFEEGNNGITVNGGYGMYGVERVGLASGFKFYGQHDWFRVLAAKILKSQKADGGWPGADAGVVDTSYYLLFLSRGRHPILMNKLRFDGDAKSPGFWANRPRDEANLARMIGKRLERPLNWQVVNVTTPWEEWLDGPILSISSHVPYKFSPEELAKIRNYVQAGGILYTQSDGGSPQFDRFARDLAKDLFQQDLVMVPRDHPIYTTESLFKIQPPVPLKMVTNGARILMLHSSIDLAKSWQARDDKGRGEPYFQLGMNLFLYATGRQELRNRLDQFYVSTPKTAPVATFPVARISYGGGYWDPEPGAWRRFVNLFWRQTGYKLEPTEVKINELKPFDPAKKSDPTNFRFAHLTGSIAKVFSPDQTAALKAYVESGGILLIDSTGGLNEFDNSVQTMLHQAFPGNEPKLLTPDHPLLRGSSPGMVNATDVVVRPVVRAKFSPKVGPPRILTVGKGAIIYSPLDITSGLLGTQMLGINGYEPAYADELMQNIVIWAIDGGKADGSAAATQPAATATPAK